MKYITFHFRPKQFLDYSKTCLKWPLKKKTKIGFQYLLSLNAGQKYCRMLQEEHSAILSAFIKLPFVIKIFVLSIFEWPFNTGFTVLSYFRSRSGHLYGSEECFKHSCASARGVSLRECVWQESW